MIRFVMTVATLFFSAVAAMAQDMPLSQILIDGEGWKKVEGNPPSSSAKVMTTSPDGSTTFAWQGGKFIEARQTNADSSVPFAPYCPLRSTIKTNPPTVWSLISDKDGRIYAATPVGIQVFDPTGRLCGVIVAPKGTVDHLAFEGDHLTSWVGNTKFTRRLKTTGVK
jgi:hypothetical protein